MKLLLVGLALAGRALSASSIPCVEGPETLCLLGGRFRVEVDWRNQHDGGSTGTGRAVSGSDKSGFFWFFNDDNIELVVKALDGRSLNGYFWFFYGALSDVEYWIRVTDTVTGSERTYHNPPGNLCGRGDTSAFADTDNPESSVPRSLPAVPASRRFEAARVRAAKASAHAGGCVPTPETLCLQDGRFQVEVDWRNQHDGGSTGTGKAISGSDKSGFFWFFSDDNIELVVKALDGRTLNGRHWLFYGALSDVEYWIRVTDTQTGEETVYHNPPGSVCGAGDTAAFCDRPLDCRGGILLASTPTQMDKEDPLLVVFRNFDLAADVDVVALHQDFYGIPWQAFAEGDTPPTFWSQRMDEIKSWADAWGKPVYLSLALVDGPGRAFLATRAVDSADGLMGESAWSEPCFNFATHPDGARWQQGFLRYVRYMVETFRPRYLTTGIEVNLFQKACDGVDPSAYDALVDVLNQAYDAAHALDPDLLVFPSLQIDFLTEVGPDGACFEKDPSPCIEANLGRQAGLKRDRFAISLYPHLIEAGGIDLDYDAYLDSVLDEVTDERVVVAETGYLSLPLTVNFGTDEAPLCTVVEEYSDARQRDYFDALIAAARRWRMDLLTWWSNRDVLPADVVTSCPCRDALGFCSVLEDLRSALGLEGELLFKGFSTMGVREFDGEPKPLFERWQQVRAAERGDEELQPGDASPAGSDPP